MHKEKCLFTLLIYLLARLNTLGIILHKEILLAGVVLPGGYCLLGWGSGGPMMPVGGWFGASVDGSEGG